MINSGLSYLATVTAGAGFFVMNAASLVEASTVCPEEIVVQDAKRSDLLSVARQVINQNGLIAVQVARGEFFIQPENPAWRIAGAAGVEIKLGKTCFIELSEQYFEAITVGLAGGKPEFIGLGVCDPADGICYWRNVAF